MRSKSTKRYLLHDGTCSRCSRVASLVEQLSGGRLEALPLRSAQGLELLQTALPGGWKHEPHLVVANGRTVRAFRGRMLSLQLLRILGPAASVTVLRELHETTPPDGSTESDTSPAKLVTRRTMLGRVAAGAAGIAAAVVASNLGGSPAQAATTGTHSSTNRRVILAPRDQWRLANEDEIPAVLWNRGKSNTTTPASPDTPATCGCDWGCTWYWVGWCQQGPKMCDEYWCEDGCGVVCAEWCTSYNCE